MNDQQKLKIQFLNNLKKQYGYYKGLIIFVFVLFLIFFFHIVILATILMFCWNVCLYSIFNSLTYHFYDFLKISFCITIIKYLKLI